MKKFLSTTLIVLVFFTAITAFFGVAQPAEALKLENPLAVDSFQEFITRLIRMLIFIAAPALALIVAVAGLRFVVSGGNPKKRESAKNMIKYGIIGFLIIILAWVLVAVLQGLVGTTQTQDGGSGGACPAGQTRVIGSDCQLYPNCPCVQ